MMNASPTLLLFACTLGLSACADPEDPLPEDIFEEGWDRATPAQRTRALEERITEHLERVEADPASASPEQVDELTALMSALRAELGADDAGRARYVELERRLDAATGD